MKNIPTTAQIAADLERLARRIAPTVALIAALVITTYNAGLALGRAVHAASDWLAANWPTRPTTTTEPTTTTQTESLADIITETGATVLIAPADEVLALRAAGLSQRAIAAQLGISRATVRRRLATV